MYVKVIVPSYLRLNIALMPLNQLPYVLWVVVDEVKQAVAVEIGIAHIKRIQIKPISRPAPNADRQHHTSRAIYSPVFIIRFCQCM
jgi:hypothetical protein